MTQTDWESGPKLFCAIAEIVLRCFTPDSQMAAIWRNNSAMTLQSHLRAAPRPPYNLCFCSFLYFLSLLLLLLVCQLAEFLMERRRREADSSAGVAASLSERERVLSSRLPLEHHADVSASLCLNTFLWITQNRSEAAPAPQVPAAQRTIWITDFSPKLKLTTTLVLCEQMWSSRLCFVTWKWSSWRIRKNICNIITHSLTWRLPNTFIVNTSCCYFSTKWPE